MLEVERLRYLASAAFLVEERERLKSLGALDWIMRFLSGEVKSYYASVADEEILHEDAREGGSDYMEADHLG